MLGLNLLSLNKYLFTCYGTHALYGYQFFYYLTCHLIVIFPIYELFFQAPNIFFIISL